MRQNEEIDRLQLPRIEDDAQLEELKSRQELVEIEENQALRVNPQLDPDRRYCRPWTLAFLNDMSDAYYKQFHTYIQVNSAVRTVELQLWLLAARACETATTTRSTSVVWSRAAHGEEMTAENKKTARRRSLELAM